MSPLLFVVLLGLLAGLVLFVVVVGAGALFNAVLNRIPAKEPKRAKKTPESQLASDEVASDEPILEPAREMQVAAAAPAVALRKEQPEPKQAPAKKRAPLSFPKREQAEVQPEPKVEAPAQPVEEAPKRKAEATPKPIVVATVAKSEPVVAEPSPVADEAAVLADPDTREAVEKAAESDERRPRRKFPRPTAKAAHEAPVAAEAQPEPEVAAQPIEEEPKAEAVDPFAAVMAALNKR